MLKRVYKISCVLLISFSLALLTPIDFNKSEREAFAVDSDLLLGCFYDNDNDFNDTLYVSQNGIDFKALTTLNNYKHEGAIKGGMSCPSIIYHNDYFWRISGWNRNDGKIWVTISYSEDLITWTAPEGDGLLTSHSTHGIDVAVDPRNDIDGKFDTVAPEWFLDDDGNVYIIVSCGYFGAFHGKPTVDQMDPYIIPVTELSAIGMGSTGGPAGTNYKWPDGLTFIAEPAQRMSSVMLSTMGKDYIDGAITKSGDVYYLYEKRDGVYIDIYSTYSLLSDNWKLVAKNVGAVGYEGMSVVNFNGKYWLYADEISGQTAIGTKYSSSAKITSFSGFQKLNFTDDTGVRRVARHGTVMVVKAGTPAYRALKKAMTLTNTNLNFVATTPVYRMYNTITSEHLFTSDKTEYDKFSKLYNQKKDYWKPEGIGWYAPSSGGTKVYRLYNPGLGAQFKSSHYYTTSTSEASDLVKNHGWLYDFSGSGGKSSTTTRGNAAFLSGGTQAVYTAYSEGLRSAHHYTASVSEWNGLDRGWDIEGDKNGGKFIGYGNGYYTASSRRIRNYQGPYSGFFKCVSQDV